MGELDFQGFQQLLWVHVMHAMAGVSVENPLFMAAAQRVAEDFVRQFGAPYISDPVVNLVMDARKNMLFIQLYTRGIGSDLPVVRAINEQEARNPGAHWVMN